MNRRGNAAVVVTLSLAVLLMFAALAVDVGYARVVDLQLQVAADAASHAATAQLDGTAEGLAGARGMAVTVARLNAAGGQSVSLDDADIVTGIYDDGAFSASTDPVEVNAVRIDARRPDLGLYFAPVMGRASIGVGARSLMVADLGGGAGAVDCFIPLAIASCMIDTHGVAGIQNVEFHVNPAGIDNIGWGRPNGTPNASWSRAQISDCEQGGTAAVGDPVGLQNGVVTSAMSAMASAINSSSTTWSTATWGPMPARMGSSDVSTSNYGRTYEGVVTIFDGGPGYCPSGAFNGNQPIVGFMWGAVYDIQAGGPAASRNLKLRLDTTNPRLVGTAAGGPDWAVRSPSAPPRMVKPE